MVKAYRVCAALLYPDAYYNSDYLTGPFVNGWLGSVNRTDSISTTEPTDTDSDSYGCAILFLYFLYSQLGKSIPSIIAAGGGTLEQTYQNLTGNTGGYTAMLQLLSPIFPAGSGPGLATDNPFPILSGEDRHVDVYTTQEPSGEEFVDSRGTASISPFTNCPEKIYGYKIWNRPMLMRVTAKARGFGRPKVTWKVNGHPVIFGGTISDSTTVYVDDPTNPSRRKKLVAPFSVVCEDGGNTSTWM